MSKKKKRANKPAAAPAEPRAAEEREPDDGELEVRESAPDSTDEPLDEPDEREADDTDEHEPEHEPEPEEPPESGGADLNWTEPRPTPEWNDPLPAHIPEVTFWPAGLAFGITLLLWGVVTSTIIVAFGAAAIVVALAGWIGDMRHEAAH